MTAAASMISPNFLPASGLSAAEAPPMDVWAALSPFMGVFFAAFFVALLVTPFMRWLAVRNGIVDWPDLKRKNHKLPVAYLGGVALFVGWLAGIVASYVVCPDSVLVGGQLQLSQLFPVSVLLGAGVITVTGLIDDVWGIRARTKVGGQLFAAAALTWEHVGTDMVQACYAVMANIVALDFVQVLPQSEGLIYFTATFVVAFFVLGGCNAVNLIDGLDGLAAGVVAIAMAGFLAIALIAGQDSAAVAYQNPIRIIQCLAVIGAVLGFLPYNWNPARIFMGDAGSLFLGFVAVTTILRFGNSAGMSLRLVVAGLIIFALPITDTALAIIRRKVRGQNIFAPDAQHIHHLLRKSGMSVKQAVLTMYGFALCFAGMGITLIALELPLRFGLAVFCVLYSFILVLGYKYSAYSLALERMRAAEDPIPAPPSADPRLPEAPTTPAPGTPGSPKTNGTTHALNNGKSHGQPV